MVKLTENLQRSLQNRSMLEDAWRVWGRSPAEINMQRIHESWALDLCASRCCFIDDRPCGMICRYFFCTGSSFHWFHMIFHIIYFKISRIFNDFHREYLSNPIPFYGNMDTQWISIAPRCSYHLPADGPRRGEDGRVASSTAKSPSSQESSGGAGEKRWKVRRVTTVVHDKSLGHFTSIKTKKNIKGISTGHFRMVLYRKKKPFASHWILGMVT